jgi:hypothetical protein
MKKKYSNQKNTFISIMCVLILISLFVGCIDNIDDRNNKPSVFIHHPQEMDPILGIVNITGSAYDPDGSESIKHIEIQIQNNTWKKAEGTVNWSYTWRSYTTEDGVITLSVKAWDGYHYSPVKQRQVVLSNPQDVNHGTHKWAIYIAAANFPENELNKLGNGGLYLAQNMSSYFIE